MTEAADMLDNYVVVEHRTGRSPAMPTTAAEIDAAAFEGELRNGRPLTVLDVRDRDAFGAWHVAAPAATVLNVPEDDVAADVAGTLAALPGDRPVRVICNVGNMSLRVAALLDRHATDVRSVRGGMVSWSRVLQAAPVPMPAPWTVVQLRREARGCLSYLVASGGDAIVVDPAPQVEPYLAEAAARGVAIRHVLDTHVHADHLSGARELATRAGAALHLSQAALARGVRYADDVAPVTDGTAIALGDVTATVVALPGHTSDMTGVLLGQAALIGGDSVFLDAIARPDLEAGEAGSADAARTLHRTLRERVGPLPDTTLLLPCHYPGGRRDGAVTAPLGTVRDAVPELALDEDAFVAQVLANMPPRPSNYLAIIGVNLGDGLDADAASRLEVGANNCAARHQPAA
jgi:glyoxylase-like metal-dependent hydrolase (beta-lactamase superfamily II)/rhodanese-related sulfurtransferase